MFKENFIGVIVVDGKIMRESKNELGEVIVKLPFGSEYVVKLKNLDTVNAVADVEIDGSIAASGLIVRPGTSVELKGFLEGLQVKNKFRFIKKTKEISEYRGDRIDDGIVRIKYCFEKRRPTYYVNPSITFPWWQVTTYTYTTNVSTSNAADCGWKQDAEGITVKGSKIQQNFSYGSTDELEEQEHVINIKLVGSTEDGFMIKRHITTKTKLMCQTCGKTWKSSYKFCPSCATYLK